MGQLTQQDRDSFHGLLACRYILGDPERPAIPVPEPVPEAAPMVFEPDCLAIGPDQVTLIHCLLCQTWIHELASVGKAKSIICMHHR